MKVSCLLAAHYYDHMVKSAIQSIIDQTYRDFELIILVNGDEKIVKEIENDFSDQRIRILYSKIKQLAHNLNIGLTEAKGDLIARMDSDDISLPTRFERQIKVLSADPSIIVCSSIATYINDLGDEISTPTIFKSTERSHINKSFWYTNPIMHPSVMFRKQEIISAKGYSEYVNEDYSLWLRLLRTYDEPFFIIDEPLIRYRIHKDQSRGRLESYATSASFLAREFLVTLNFKYLIGFFVLILKTFAKSKKQID